MFFARLRIAVRLDFTPERGQGKAPAMQRWNFNQFSLIEHVMTMSDNTHARKRDGRGGVRENGVSKDWPFTIELTPWQRHEPRRTQRIRLGQRAGPPPAGRVAAPIQTPDLTCV